VPHDINFPWDNEKCLSWAPLRSFKVKLFKKIPLEYFLERDTAQWLKMGEDVLIHPLMSEIAGKKNISFIKEKIYVYDISGEQHDIIALNNRNYMAFKLLRVPDFVERNDPRSRFASYQDAYNNSQKNKDVFFSNIQRITPVFADFQNELGFTLWG